MYVLLWFFTVVQYNKFLKSCQIPSWICYNFEGNLEDDTANEEWISSTVEMDVYEATVQDNENSFPLKGMFCPKFMSNFGYGFFILVL